jgi:cytochrome P450 family 49 subfamily A
VIFPHYVLSNSEDHFWEPQKFLPERWLKSQISQCPERSKKIHPYASLPFGIGRRICLGKRFADAEMIILLAKV